MKTLLCSLSLLLCVTAAQAQPHIVSIAGPFPDPDFGPYVIVSAQQLKNKSVTIEAASTPTFADAYPGAFYDCAEEAQTVVAVFPSGPPWNFGFFRARNDPCNNFAAAWEPPKFLLNPLNL